MRVWCTCLPEPLSHMCQHAAVPLAATACNICRRISDDLSEPWNGQSNMLTLQHALTPCSREAYIEFRNLSIPSSSRHEK